MNQHDRDFDELLRRVLREEADAVMPADDGLERIQARLTRPRPLPVAWVMAVFSGAGRRAEGVAHSAQVWLQTLSGAAQARLGWPRGPRDSWARGWRSPAVLAACATVAVVAGILALTPLPQQAVSGTADLIRSIGGGHAGGTGQGGGQAEGGGPQPVAGTSSSASPGRQGHRHATAGPSASVVPSATPDPAASSSAAASPSPSSSPSPTPTPSCPSPSPSPSPSPTPSSSPGPCSSTGPTTGPTTAPGGGSSPAPDPAAG